MKRVFQIMIAFAMVIGSSLLSFGLANASDTFISVSPMRESMVLNPGDSYKSAFVVSNPGYSEQDLNYHVEIKPFYMDENYHPVFDASIGSDKQMIKDWITITGGESGTIPPNENMIVEYEINVPENAPAGGQYACLSAIADVVPEEKAAINIGEGIAINHVVLAEITGSSIVSGEILDAGIQGFLFAGNVMAYSTVENTGNVHSLATYTMKVQSFFTGEELYNNSENVDDHYVLPDRTFYNETFWEETPMVGVFDVGYLVEFQGKTSELHRIVIVCPWWLLVIIIFGIVILTIRIVSLMKIRKMTKTVEKAKETESKKNK